MKRLLTTIIIGLLLATGLNRPAYNLNAAEGATPRVELTGSFIDENKIKVEVNLTRNTGLMSATFTLNYDTDNLKFYNYKAGGTIINDLGEEVDNTALTSLNLTTSYSSYSTPYEQVAQYNEQFETEEGEEESTEETETEIEIEPFEFYYSGSENDTSTGTLFILYFKLKENAEHIDYSINLDASNGTKISAYKTVDEEITTKGFDFRVDEDGLLTTEVKKELETWQIWLIVGGSVVIVIIGLYFLQLYIKKKAKAKIAEKLKNQKKK